MKQFSRNNIIQELNMENEELFENLILRHGERHHI